MESTAYQSFNYYLSFPPHRLLLLLFPHRLLLLFLFLCKCFYDPSKIRLAVIVLA